MEFGDQRRQPFETLAEALDHLAQFGDFSAGFALFAGDRVEAGCQFFGLFGEFTQQLFKFEQANVKNAQQLFDSLVGCVAHGLESQFREMADETTSNAQWKALDNEANR